MNKNDKLRNLSMLSRGESGVVVGVSGESTKLRHRLLEMGITTGVRVTVTHIAPLKDPVSISVRGYSLSLRHEDAVNIQIAEKADEDGFLQALRAAELARNKAVEASLCDSSHADIEDDSARERVVRLTDFIVSGGSSLTNECDDCNEACNKKSCALQSEEKLKIALAGNPNCGKTTLFNALTGAKEYVGNRPGVTVDKKEGVVKAFHTQNGSAPDATFCTHGHEITLVDLPGIYSLSPNTMEEIVSREFVLREKPAAIINIVDATNLERNLYLTVQLLELEVPTILALNMMDSVQKQGDEIDIKELSRRLGVPVVPISARTGKGVDALMESAQQLINAAHIQHHEGFLIEPDNMFCDSFTHVMHHRIGEIIAPYAKQAGIPLHFADMKLLEGDTLVADALQLDAAAKSQVNDVLAEYSRLGANDADALIAQSRYNFISSVAAAVYKTNSTKKPDISGKIDSVITNKFLALPIFALVMLLTFVLTFSTLGAFLSDLVGAFIDGTFVSLVSGALSSLQAAPWLSSLICDGIISGIGGVLTFLPQIAILFFMLSLLEDSGYMARIAFIMDRPMRALGLSGKSIIPLLMGFGCTVPATMSARTLSDVSDKRMTILLLPFMSCSAKLPVYAFIAGAFFAKGNVLVILGLYCIGILCGILSGLALKNTAFKDNDAPFLIELPPYRLPTLKNTFIHVWEKVEHFLVKAGTLIFAMSVVLWFLLNYSFSLTPVTEQANSILGVIGGAIAPIFTLNGFPFWQAAVALLVGLIAKEAAVSALSMFYGISAEAGAMEVSSVLGADFSPASAFSFLVFLLLYTPCVAAVTTMSRELNSKRWTVFTIAFQICVAYIVSAIAYAAYSLFS